VAGAKKSSQPFADVYITITAMQIEQVLKKGEAVFGADAL
jgi:hypothetical protein